MKYLIAGLTALALSSLVATSAPATVGTGPDVCSYIATNVFGVSCPVRNGQTVCLSQTAKTGNCDQRLECFGGPGFFCKATLIPVGGPEAKCPFGSVRPRGFNCVRPIVIPPPFRTPTFTPTGTPIPDTPTGTPTGTAAATATVTDTPQEATATATDTPEATATDTPPAATASATQTGTPTGTAALATATATQTGTPTGTVAASLVLRF